MGEFELGTHEGCLEYGRVLRVAHQEVRKPQGEWVHPAAHRHALGAMEATPRVLDRRLDSGSNDNYFHVANSSEEIG